MATNVKSRSVLRASLAVLVLIVLVGCGDDGGDAGGEGGSASGSSCAAAFETWSQKEATDPQNTYYPGEIIKTLEACDNKMDWKISAGEHPSLFEDMASVDDIWTRMCMRDGELPACAE